MRQEIKYFLSLVENNEDYEFLKEISRYYVRGNKDIFTFIFIKNNSVIKYYHRTMDPERRFWCHRFYLWKDIQLTCSCGGSIEEIIKKEIHYLTKLQKYKFFPKIEKESISNNYIIMEYCGKDFGAKKNTGRTIEIPNDFREQIKEISDIFDKENIQHTDLNMANICMIGKTLKIIDFGCVQRLNEFNKYSSAKEFPTNFVALNKLFDEYIKVYRKRIRFI